MSEQPTLVIMAAGMGSRFGGLKQLIGIDEAQHPIIDFSLFDARRAGFERVAFIIKHSIEADFRAAVGRRMERWFDVEYIFQEPDVLPEGFNNLPAGREKPWGTGHAVACCRGKIRGPFAVINADDFYGAGAFETIYRFLTADRGADRHAMLGYRLRNTLTENGSVSRGICDVRSGLLAGITERTKIEKRGTAAAWLDDGTEHPLTGDETVSMNFWGFGSNALPEELWQRFAVFLRETAPANPLKAEFYLPEAVSALLREGKAQVEVLPCEEVWHGVTYQADLEPLRSAVADMKRTGRYPENLWGGISSV